MFLPSASELRYTGRESHDKQGSGPCDQLGFRQGSGYSLVCLVSLSAIFQIKSVYMYKAEEGMLQEIIRILENSYGRSLDAGVKM